MLFISSLFNFFSMNKHNPPAIATANAADEPIPEPMGMSDVIAISKPDEMF